IEDVPGCWTPAAVWKNGVSEGQFRECDLAASEESRRIGSQLGFDPSGVAEVGHGIDPGDPADAHSGSILRYREPIPPRDRAFGPIAYGLGSAFAKDGSGAADHHRALIQCGLFPQRCWQKAFAEGSRINEGEHRGPGRAT